MEGLRDGGIEIHDAFRRLRIEVIDTLTDPRVADYRNVPDGERLRRRGVFVAEGRLVVHRLLTESSCRILSLLLTEVALTSLRDALDSLPADVPIYLVSQDAMNGIVGFNIHRGCLAIGERPQPRTALEILAATPEARILLILEGVGNPDNVGGVFRNGRALGASAVLVGPNCCDPLYRKAIRVSMGAALVLPFGEIAPWPEGLDQLRSAGYRLVALTPARDAVPLTQWTASLPRSSRVALMLGSEGQGLSEAALEKADVRVSIPLGGEVDSLNVATAAAIALHRLNEGG
jgi:tRNA G18 (ribose-2'-O)-methylase SpoU